MGRRRPSTTASTGGRDVVFGTGCSRRWQPATRCQRARRSTRPTSRRSEPRSAEKGGAGAGDRSLARRPDHQDPRAHRRRRTPLRDHAHAGQRRRRERGAGAYPCRQGLRRRALRRTIRGHGAVPVIPGRRTRTTPIRYDRARYKDRHLIENAFCRLKDFRRIATRYDKLAANFLSAVAIATLVAYWL